MRVFLLLGAVFGALGVAAGAFGAHALSARLEPRLLEVFETAVRYQMYHALALLAVGLLARELHTRAIRVAGWGFIAGIFLFSGSLYVLVFSGVRALGMVTPLGGVAFIVGWIALVFAALQRR